MHFRFLTPLIPIVLSLLAPCPELQASAPSVPLAKMDATITAEMQRQKIPGLALAVVHKGEVVALKGYGLANVELGVPVTPDTIFQSGSVGKQFTAAAILLLMEDGKISLDDPITKYYPEAPYHWHRITVRNLLTGTSGLPFDFDEATFDLRKDYTEDEFVRLAFGLKLHFEPGVRWSYSNVGFVVLGCLVRKVSGQFYGDLLRDRVFQPAGMATTHIISDADIVPHRAAGYRLVKGELKNQEWVSPANNSTGDGSLQLSIRDFLAWDKAIRAKAVLKPATWAQAFTPVKLASGRTWPYGFGWFIDDDPGVGLRIHHGGAWQGFKTYISRYMTEDLTILVLANLSDANPADVVDRVAELFSPRLVPAQEPTGDMDPVAANQLREILNQVREGKLKPEVFSYPAAQPSPMRTTAYQSLLAPLGDPTGFRLIQRLQRGDDVVHRGRILFKNGKALEVSLGLAPDQRLSSLWLWEKKVP